MGNRAEQPEIFRDWMQEVGRKIIRASKEVGEDLNAPIPGIVLQVLKKATEYEMGEPASLMVGEVHRGALEGLTFKLHDEAADWAYTLGRYQIYLNGEPKTPTDRGDDLELAKRDARDFALDFRWEPGDVISIVDSVTGESVWELWPGDLFSESA